MRTDFHDTTPLQMVFPCIFYRMASFECALCRYGRDRTIKSAIMETLKSVLRGVIQKRSEVKPKSEKMLIDVAHNLEKEFISEGLENPVETVTCFGLLKIDDRFVCGPHNLWFSSCFQEVIH